MTRQKNLLEQALGGGGIVASVTGFRVIANLALQLILARLLVPESFGIVAFALSVVGFFGIIVNIQGDKAVVRSDEEKVQATMNTAFTIELGLSVIVGILFFVLAPTIFDLLGKPGATAFARALMLTLIADRLMMPRACLEREMNFGLTNIPEAAGIVTNVIVAVVLAFGGAGPWAIVGGVLAKSIVRTSLLWLILPYRPTLQWDADTAKKILQFGAPLTGAAIIAYFYWNIDDILVGKVSGDEALGYYWLAFKFPHYILAAQTSLNAVLFAAFSRTRNDAQLLRGFNLTTRMSAYILLPLCSIALTLGAPTIQYFFGERWLPATFSFQVFMVLITLRGVFAHWTQVLTYKGETKFQFRVILINAILLVSLGYPLLLRYDYNGMAVAVLATILFSFVFMMPKLKSLIPARYGQLLLRPFFAFFFTTVAGFLVFQTPSSLGIWQYLGAVIALGFLYLVLLTALDRKNLFAVVTLISRHALHRSS